MDTRTMMNKREEVEVRRGWQCWEIKFLERWAPMPLTTKASVEDVQRYVESRMDGRQVMLILKAK